MSLATRINAYLTPVRRQALYQIIGLIGVVLTAVSPAMSLPVAQWTQIVFAAGTIASLILAAIMTKAPQWPAIYSGLAALVAALVGASLLTSGAADVALRLVQAAITVAPLIIILARTDVSTPDGSPAHEVITALAGPVVDAILAPPASTPVPRHAVDPVSGDGTPPTTTLN